MQLHIKLLNTSMFMKKLKCLLLLCLLSANLLAQEKQVDNTLNKIRKELTTKKTYSVNDEILFTPGNEMFVLTRIKSWIGDSLSIIREQAVSVISHIGLKTQEAAFRQEAVRLLTIEANDKDASIAKTALRYLIHFNLHNFTLEACDNIRSLLKEQSIQLESVVKLVGFLNLTDKQVFLQNILNSGNASTNLQWNTHLALARMGNEQSAKVILALVKNYPVDDNIMYHILPDLVYTRSQQIFTYLLAILNSEKKTCTSPNPNFSGNIICGYRVMEEISGAFVDFPLKRGRSGDIITKDYDKALSTARNWFKSNQAYTFNMEVY